MFCSRLPNTRGRSFQVGREGAGAQLPDFAFRPLTTIPFASSCHLFTLTLTILRLARTARCDMVTMQLQLQKTRLAPTTTKTEITQKQSLEVVQTFLHGSVSVLRNGI